MLSKTPELFASSVLFINSIKTLGEKIIKKLFNTKCDLVAYTLIYKVWKTGINHIFRHIETY